MNNNISILILAAGLSERMKKFKPLLKYNGLTFLENIINKGLSISNEIIVVTGNRQSEIVELIETTYPGNTKIKLIHNPNYNDSMYISLLTGIKEVKQGNAVLYHFIDQPTIPEQFYINFANQIDDKADIIQPIFKNKKGHPLFFNFNFIKHLLNSDSGSNLRDEIWNANIIKKFWDCDYPQILKDYDTPDDYKDIEEI